MQKKPLADARGAHMKGKFMLNRFEIFSMAFFNFNKNWNKIATEEMKKYNLKGPFALYFSTLYNYDGDMTLSKMTELCGKDKADISRSIATMEARGFVKREGTNKYRAKLILTEEGAVIAKTLSQRAEELVEAIGADISPAQRENFYNVLHIIAANMEKMSKEIE